jgi:tRNA-Thr(GGU) m(6)t(6)A37 methyltransferase TsaA
MSSKTSYQLTPIGRVQEAEGFYVIHIDETIRPAMKLMEGFSHIHVLWWADQLDTDEGRAILQGDLPYAPGTVAGVFANRSPARPNPIGLTTCFVLDVDPAAGTISVAWIDALDGTPVLDIKPYIPVSDRARDVSVAEWLADWPEWMEDAAKFDFAAHGLDD